MSGNDKSKEPSDADKQKLEQLRKKYADCKAVGCADESALFQEYTDLAVELLIDLSGKLDVPAGPEPDIDPGYQKPGGWGANTDPLTWTVTGMKDDPSKFKVVDNAGKNVATEFKSMAGAQDFINDAKGGTVPPVPPPTPGGSDKDKLGIIKIHKDKAGGQTNEKFTLYEKRRNYASGKASEDSVEYTASASSKEHNSDVEATFYTKINSFKTNEPDSVSDKLTGPNHSDGNCCWVIPEFMTDGSGKKTLETEKPHPKNHSVNPKPLTGIGGSIVGKWFGHKAITYVKGGERYVESWIHFPVDNIDTVAGEQGEWRQYCPTTKMDSAYVKANGLLTTCRLDGVKKGDPPSFKYCSVREIEAPV